MSYIYILRHLLKLSMLLLAGYSLIKNNFNDTVIYLLLANIVGQGVISEQIDEVKNG